MFLGVTEHNRQHKGTCMLLQRQPFISKHDPSLPINIDHVVIIIRQLLRLFACANGDGLIRINLVKVG